MAASTLDLFTAPIRSAHYSPNLGADLRVTARTFPIGTEAAAVLAGSAIADGVALSADGRAWVDGWHEVARHGAECGDVVYVERHTRGGAVFHGYVDRVSRRIVQTG